jgi:hypothetical protein
MKKNEVNGTAFLFDFLWMACFFHDRAYALILWGKQSQCIGAYTYQSTNDKPQRITWKEMQKHQNKLEQEHHVLRLHYEQDLRPQLEACPHAIEWR